MAEEEKPEKPVEDSVPETDDSSLEQPSTVVADDEDTDALEKKSGDINEPASTAESAVEDNRSLREKVIRRLGSFNPYLVLFVLVLLTGLAVAYIANRLNEQSNPTNVTFEGSDLDQETLDDLLATDQNIGTVDQTLTVAANAIFDGKILVKGDLDVAGTIRAGGELNLAGITVAGTSQFDEVNIDNNLSILGNASIQETLTVQGGANISGNVSVGGTISASAISADAIEFTGDLNLSRHIDTSGGRPQLVKGTSLGSGGTASISGNDIAGTVSINTGGSPPAGIFVRINFTRSYNATPNVQITPVGSSSGGLNYYVERDTGGFSIGTANTPNGATTYRFDYFVVE